ncbi:LAME_0D03928g1_1 [Lachancea meyersii CBS 8951]|uniref:Small ribosomal subunit protein mS33 n=1 Tax=Lachancea meyersii CBS 8951 TaxID=1266667 RepID=A0A1G4J7S3_9SACH|nr:LAME_0D03928g1_1 [Lachancea meyersii CBS 8951]
MSVPKQRLLEVASLSAKIFNQNFNPTATRNGGKILAKRLKGPSIAGYYGNPDFLKFKHLKTLYPGFKFADQEEDYRLLMNEARKRRGKGAPTKKKEASKDKGKTKKRK